MYAQCRRLGVKITPHDLDPDDLQVLFELHCKFEEINQKKNMTKNKAKRRRGK